MPAFALPMLPGEISVCQQAEGLDVFLTPINEPVMSARIGQETEVTRDGSMVITQGEKFRTREGWVQGRRYLYTNPTGQIVAALNVSVRKNGRRQEAVASNVFTRPEHRRHGLASALLARAQDDFPGLMADNTLSQDGAALVAHASENKPRARMR